MHYFIVHNAVKSYRILGLSPKMLCNILGPKNIILVKV